MRLIRKILRHINKMYSKQGRELNRIKNIPRYNRFTTKINNVSFIGIDSSSFIGQYREIFERDIYSFIADKDNPFIIDCGSNIGLSIIRYKEHFPNAKIIGFEPDPNIFKVLKSNIESFDLKNVDLYQKAVWIENGVLLFEQEGSAGGKLSNQKSESVITVETVDFKLFLDKSVDFLKIDIEGAENGLLEDIKDKLWLVKNIFIEFHSSVNDSQGFENILSILAKNGFRYYIESAGIYSNNPLIERSEVEGYDNLINIWGYRI